MAEVDEFMKRPCSSDAYVQARAAELYKPIIADYLAEDFSEKEWPHIVTDMSKRLRGHVDGYELARDLECDGWAVDRRLPDVMDEVVDAYGKAVAELTSQWIQVYGIKLDYGIGHLVQVKHYEGVGTVSSLFPEKACYGVHYPGMAPNSYYVIEAEKVTNALIEAAA